MSNFFRPLLLFLLHLAYVGPLLMGILDSSFLVLPFGNDLLVVALVAHHHSGVVVYVLSAACGSTLGVFVLALVARKFGEAGVRKIAGEKQFKRLSKRIGKHSGAFVALACLAPPPFPFTLVIAAASALDYSLWRMLTINFFARAARFALLGYLAIRFGPSILRIAHSTPFYWGMGGFILLCVVASAFSIHHWLHTSLSSKPA